MGSIKNVISEPIEDHDEYHMMVRESPYNGFLKPFSNSSLVVFLLLLICENDGAISPTDWNILEETFD